MVKTMKFSNFTCLKIISAVELLVGLKVRAEVYVLLSF